MKTVNFFILTFSVFIFLIGSSYAADAPDKAILISPNGSESNPVTYTWSAVSDATWYYLWVDDASGNKIKKWYTATRLLLKLR